MATVYTGKDVAITFGAMTVRFKEIRVRIMGNKYNADASDTLVEQSGTGTLNATITITGWDSDITNGFGFDDVGALVLTKLAPSALTWVNKATTPVSKFPTNFFTLFPLAKMRVDSAEGGTAGPNDPADWTCEISTNNIDGDTV